MLGTYCGHFSETCDSVHSIRGDARHLVKATGTKLHIMIQGQLLPSKVPKVWYFTGSFSDIVTVIKTAVEGISRNGWHSNKVTVNWYRKMDYVDYWLTGLSHFVAHVISPAALIWFPITLWQGCMDIRIFSQRSVKTQWDIPSQK